MASGFQARDEIEPFSHGFLLAFFTECSDIHQHQTHAPLDRRRFAWAQPYPFHSQGDYVAARAFYDRALQLVPHSRLLQENLAKLDRLEKRLQEVGEKDT